MEEFWCLFGFNQGFIFNDYLVWSIVWLKVNREVGISKNELNSIEHVAVLGKTYFVIGFFSFLIALANAELDFTNSLIFGTLNDSIKKGGEDTFSTMVRRNIDRLNPPGWVILIGNINRPTDFIGQLGVHVNKEFTEFRVLGDELNSIPYNIFITFYSFGFVGITTLERCQVRDNTFQV